MFRKKRQIMTFHLFGSFKNTHSYILFYRKQAVLEEFELGKVNEQDDVLLLKVYELVLKPQRF